MKKQKPVKLIILDKNFESHKIKILMKPEKERTKTAFNGIFKGDWKFLYVIKTPKIIRMIVSLF